LLTLTPSGFTVNKYIFNSRCGSAVKWWKWENKKNREDPGSLRTPGHLFKKYSTVNTSAKKIQPVTGTRRHAPASAMSGCGSHSGLKSYLPRTTFTVGVDVKLAFARLISHWL
jgi:hypothetical protein